MGFRHSEKTKELLRKKFSRRKNHNSGRSLTGNIKYRIGIPLYKKTKERISKVKSKIVYPLLLSPDGKRYKIEPSLHDFCKKNNLKHQCLRNLIVKDNWKQYKGWKIYRDIMPSKHCGDAPDS